MRVLVVTVVHTPLDARIHHRQLRALRAADVEVTYLAPWRDTGTDLAEVVTGVRPVDVPRAVGRRRLRALRHARRLVARLGPAHDLVLLHDPELLLAVLGRRRLPPVVLDVHEDLAGSLPDRAWVPARLRRPAGWFAARLERLAERRCALLLAEHAYQQRFTRPHPVVPNVPWLPAEVPPAGTLPRVVQVGRLSVGRGVHELLALGASLAAEPCLLDGDPSRPVRLELIGPADAEVRDAVQAAHDRGEVVWHGFVPNDRALALVAGSVAGLSLLHDLPNYRVSRPTKVVEYLAAGVPAIVTPLPEAEAIVRAADAGRVVPVGDLPRLRTAVEALAADGDERRRAGASGRAHVGAHASWDAAAGAFVDELRRLATSGRTR